MGIPVRSNIFRVGSEKQKYFTRFPIQVAVLFSPTDSSFSTAFKDLFLHLDQITGKDVAFFAILDPPIDWQYFAQSRDWWQEYQAKVGKIGFSFDVRTLVYEIARRFGVSWRELPTLVISTNLWAAEFVTMPTSADQIEEQLGSLTQLVKEWGQPTIAQIIHLLEEKLDGQIQFHPANNELRLSLNQLYGVLETYEEESHQLDISAFRRHLGRELRLIEPRTNILRRARKSARRFDDVELVENKLFDDLATDVAGRFIPPTTVAVRAFENLRNYQHVQLSNLLDEASLVMIESSLNAGNFLENLLDDNIPGLEPIRFDRSGRSKNLDSIDFTPGAQGVWKSLEREANLSVIQAARNSRGIEMPGFFARFRPRFAGDSRVYTGRMHGRKVYRDINCRDRVDQTRHEFFTLGNSWHITKAMLRDPAETLEKIIRDVLHGPLPKSFLDDWKSVIQIRNNASHISPLSRREYKETLDLILDPEFIAPLMKLKESLRT